MKNTSKYMAFLLGIGLLLSIITPVLADSTIGGITDLAFEEVDPLEEVLATEEGTTEEGTTEEGTTEEGTTEEGTTEEGTTE
ncbi:MAG: hypothetical protein GYA51_01625, partial [Candidatus Methanofastidiosa archaeon]|nr:hypothetical protein [Candidatus Methanofastidiosa archaeon]